MKKDSCCISAVHASNSPDVSVTFSGAPLDLMACMIFIMQLYVRRGLATKGELLLMALSAVEDLNDD